MEDMPICTMRLWNWNRGCVICLWKELFTERTKGEENNYDEKGSFDGMFRFEKQINHERKNQM